MVSSVTVALDANVGKTPEEQAKHDADMRAVADAEATKLSAKDARTGQEVTLTQVVENPVVATRPEDIPEKFWDTDKGVVNVTALLKSQKDGETALLAAGKPADTVVAKTDAEITAANAAAAAEIKPTGDQDASIAAASAEFAEKGALTEETYVGLEKTGLSRNMVNDYIEGQRSIVTTLQNAAFGEFEGGKDTYEKAVVWAKEKLTDDEISAIDVQITSRNAGIVKQGAAALAAKYAANADIAPDTTITGGGNAPSTGAHFNSSAEMQAAMRDPKYKIDAAFRAQVASKIDASDKAGVKLFG